MHNYLAVGAALLALASVADAELVPLPPQPADVPWPTVEWPTGPLPRASTRRNSMRRWRMRSRTGSPAWGRRARSS